MRWIVFAAALFPVVAFAQQQQQQQQSPAEQALGAKLMQELQGGLNCSAQLISAQTDLAKANARIKELEAEKDKPK